MEQSDLQGSFGGVIFPGVPASIFEAKKPQKATTAKITIINFLDICLLLLGLRFKKSVKHYQ
jgi:hypothetical protein